MCSSWNPIPFVAVLFSSAILILAKCLKWFGSSTVYNMVQQHYRIKKNDNRSQKLKYIPKVTKVILCIVYIINAPLSTVGRVNVTTVDATNYH